MSFMDKNTFCIAVKPTEGGYVRIVKITIEEDAVDSQEMLRINLPEHPLYPVLRAYVMGNGTLKL